MNCPHGFDVGDPPRAVNCTAPICQCAMDCMAYEDENNEWEARRTGWPAWLWWARVRGEA